ncbi:hypothetical protein G6L13_09845 [Agrobacterium tumefaciens]|uniref:hypothetical protein n=1 Tax=Agrobacterium tumefaciens TaxID=358 RepID=UPI000DD3A253|nr:hypothetical protein [Agrobacterium tumefaciens]NTA80787.1 hypothetical protein [Agrobacterium tumefaciens]
MSDKDSAALDIVNAIFTDIRGRAVIKWLFDAHGSENFIGRFDDGEELRGIDLEVQGQIKAAWQKIVAEGLSKFSRPMGWRCFHCDEVFYTEQDARLHFGMDQCSDPACKIKMGAEKSLLVALRRAENELQDAWAAIHNENTEAAKAYYAQQSRHGEQLRAAEELGFERGTKDSTAHIAALEEQSLRNRKLRDEAQHDALLWQHSVATGDHPPLLLTVWNQRREAIARAAAAERELEIMLQRYERWMPVTGDRPAGFHPNALFEFYCIEDEPEDPENPEYWKTATWAERPTDAVFWCAIVSPRGPHERTFIAYPTKKDTQDAAQ